MGQYPFEIRTHVTDDMHEFLEQYGKDYHHSETETIRRLLEIAKQKVIG